MFKMPLIFGADPRIIKKGATIRLKSGDWKLLPVGIVDTLYSVHYANGDRVGDVIQGDSVVQASITTPGTERVISLFVVRV